MSGISVTPEALSEKASEIDALDEWLDAVSGSKAAGKRAIKNALIREFSGTDVVDSLVAQVVSYLNDNDADDEFTAAFFFDLSAKLDSSLGDEAEEFLKVRVESETSNQENLSASEDEVRSKLEERKQLVKEFQALKGILEMYGEAASIASIGDYQQRRGAMPGQKRKPRKINRMAYSINDVPLEEDKNSLSGVAGTVGIKVRDLKKILEEAGVDLKNPSDFTVTVNGNTVSAVAPIDDDDDDEVLGDDEDE